MYLILLLSLRMGGKPLDSILHKETSSQVRHLSQATHPSWATSKVLIFQKGLLLQNPPRYFSSSAWDPLGECICSPSGIHREAQLSSSSVYLIHFPLAPAPDTWTEGGSLSLALMILITWALLRAWTAALHRWLVGTWILSLCGIVRRDKFCSLAVP